MTILWQVSAYGAQPRAAPRLFRPMYAMPNTRPVNTPTKGRPELFSAVPAGLVRSRESYPGLRPISVKLFGMFFVKTPTKSSS
jgi:hypothetical protein